MWEVCCGGGVLNVIVIILIVKACLVALVCLVGCCLYCGVLCLSCWKHKRAQHKLRQTVLKFRANRQGIDVENPETNKT